MRAATVAALCIGIALGVVTGGLVDLWLTGPAGAARSAPTRIAGVRIVWVEPPRTSGSLRCYEARKPLGKTPGWWLCG